MLSLIATMRLLKVSTSEHLMNISFTQKYGKLKGKRNIKLFFTMIQPETQTLMYYAQDTLFLTK